MGIGHGVGGGYPDAFHVNGCYAETLDRKTGSNFGSVGSVRLDRCEDDLLPQESETI